MTLLNAPGVGTDNKGDIYIVLNDLSYFKVVPELPLAYRTFGTGWTADILLVKGDIIRIGKHRIVKVK